MEGGGGRGMERTEEIGALKDETSEDRDHFWVKEG